MKLNPSDLSRHLTGTLSLAYWVAGDEPLLVIEACDQIRAAATEQGFSNRQVSHVDAQTDWQEVLASANSLSLFEDKKLIELRFNNGKPNANAIKILGAYLAHANPDTILLIASPKLEANTVKTKAYQALEPQLQSVTLWPVATTELPRWISARLQTQGYAIDDDALQLLCANIEGNLLAAKQQLMQLTLACEDTRKTIDLSVLKSVIANDARFDVYETVDKALNGATAAALRAIDGLRGEGITPANLSWIFSREIQALIGIRHNAKTVGASEALRQARVWKRREPIVRSALKRLKMKDLEVCLQMAQQLDLLAKGQLAGDAWDAMSSLVMRIGGINTPIPQTLR